MGLKQTSRWLTDQPAIDIAPWTSIFRRGGGGENMRELRVDYNYADVGRRAK